MCSLPINNRFKKGLYVSMVAVYILLYILIVFNYTAYVGQECVTITGRRTDGHTKTLPKPLREAAIEHAKEITQQDMSDSLDRGKKGKKKRKNPFKLLLFHSFSTLL